MDAQINNYISKRYVCWLDFSFHHCSRAGIPNEATDVLNEVLISICQRDEAFITDLLHQKCKAGTAPTKLDAYILNVIRRNVYSLTAPYHAKYKTLPIDNNKDVSDMDIEDLNTDEPDRSAYILKRMHEIREIIQDMGFSHKAIEIFEFRFFNDGEFKNWDGDENIKELYDVYSRIMNALRKKIKGEIIF